MSSVTLPAADLLARDPEPLGDLDEDYMSFIERAATNEIECRVKMADLKDNLDMSPDRHSTDRDHQRIGKYGQASAYLKRCGVAIE